MTVRPQVTPRPNVTVPQHTLPHIHHAGKPFKNGSLSGHCFERRIQRQDEQQIALLHESSKPDGEIVNHAAVFEILPIHFLIRKQRRQIH